MYFCSVVSGKFFSLKEYATYDSYNLTVLSSAQIPVPWWEKEVSHSKLKTLKNVTLGVLSRSIGQVFVEDMLLAWELTVDQNQSLTRWSNAFYWVRGNLQEQMAQNGWITKTHPFVCEISIPKADNLQFTLQPAGR